MAAFGNLTYADAQSERVFIRKMKQPNYMLTGL